MKFTTCILTLLSSVQLLSAQSYVLDKEGYLPPKGVILEDKTSMTLEDGKIEISANERVVKGEMKRSMTSDETLTHLGDNKILSLMKEDLTKSSGTIGANKMPKESKEGPLKGIEILYQKVDGKWIGGAKDKKLVLTDEQKKEVEDELEDLNEKESLYGYEFRNVGDTWDMEKVLLTKLGGDGKLEKAEGKMTFQEIVDVNGHKCAKLLCKIHVIGVKDDNKMSLKGEVTVWRSLKYFTDVKARGSLMTIMEPSSDRAQIKITGNSVIKSDMSIKLPALAK